MKKLVCSVLFAAVAAGSFGADTWAAVDGSPDASGTENDPMDLYTAITSQAKDGMTGSVYIKPGHYKLEDILPDGVDAIIFDRFDASASQPRRSKLLIAGSTGNPFDVVIDGCGKHRFLDSRDANISSNMKTLTVAGLTVSNCQTTATSKSAISLAKGGSGDARIDPVGIVTNCVFVDCHSTAEQSGGAIYGNRVQALDCAFDTCTVSNQAGNAYGGAVAVLWNGAYLARCTFRNCHVYSKTAQAYGGGAYISPTDVSRVEDSWFENCSCWSDVAKKDKGGALGGAAEWVRNTMFTNCVAHYQDAAFVSAKAEGVTIVDCRSAYHVCDVSGFNHSIMTRCEATGDALIAAVSEGADWYESIVRDNRSWYHAIDDSYKFADAPNGGHVISNCVFSGNVVTCDTSGNNPLLNFAVNGGWLHVVGCLFSDNTWGTNRGMIQFMSTMGNGEGATFRNCFFGPQNTAKQFLYLNYGTADTAPVTIENSSFIQKANTEIITRNNTSFDRFRFRNCFFWSQNNKYLNTASSVTNCVLVDIGGHPTADNTVSLEPETGNRVLTLAALKLAGGTTVTDPATFDWRPTKASPLVDACTNRFDVAWAQQCSKKKGPWDMGDGTWTEKPYVKVTACVGIPGYEKTFQTGVAITRNNVNPRRYNNYLDIGCFEYYAAPGLMLLVK